jgi:hypothetical protein
MCDISFPALKGRAKLNRRSAAEEARSHYFFKDHNCWAMIKSPTGQRPQNRLAPANLKSQISNSSRGERDVAEPALRRANVSEKPRLHLDRRHSGTTEEIIGVISDFKNGSLQTEAEPEIFIPHAQNGFGGMWLLVRTSVFAILIHFIKGKGPGRRKESQVVPDPRVRYGQVIKQRAGRRWERPRNHNSRLSSTSLAARLPVAMAPWTVP